MGEKGRGERASDGLEFYLRLVLFFSRILLHICAIIENRDAPPFAFYFFFFVQGRRMSVDHLLSVHFRSGRISWTMYLDLTPTNSRKELEM